MCMEDVRIGRQMTVENATVTAVVGTWDVLFKARGERRSLRLSIAREAFADALDTVDVAVRWGRANPVVIGVLSIGHPTMLLRVEEDGPYVQAEILVSAFGANDIDVDGWEHYWTAEPPSKS